MKEVSGHELAKALQATRTVVAVCAVTVNPEGADVGSSECVVAVVNELNGPVPIEFLMATRNLISEQACSLLKSCLVPVPPVCKEIRPWPVFPYAITYSTGAPFMLLLAGADHCRWMLYGEMVLAINPVGGLLGTTEKKMQDGIV